MPTLEEIVQEMQRRGIDPNQIQSPATPPVQESRIQGYGTWAPMEVRQIPQWPREGWFNRNAPSIGGTVGGVVGGALTSPSGGWGAVPLAALGGAWGKAAQQEERMNQGWMPESYGEIFKEQGKSAAWEGGMELAGMGVAKGAGKALAPMKKKILPGALELGEKLSKYGSRIPKSDLTQEAAEHLTKRSVIATPGQMTVSPNIDLLENMVQGSAFGGGYIHNLKKVLQPKAIKVAAKELSEEFWEQAGRTLSPSEVGQLFEEAIVNKKTASQRILKMLYGQVDEATKGMAGVNLTTTKAYAQQLLNEAAKSKGLGSSSSISRVAKKVMALDNVVDFKTAQAIRSNLLEEARKLEGLLNAKLPKVNRATTILSKQIDDAMEVAAKEHSPDAYALWRRANAANKKLYTDIISNDYVEAAVKMAQRHPEKVANSLFQRHAVEPIKAVKKIMDKQTWDSLVATYMDDLLQSSMKPLAGDITEEQGVLWGKAFLQKFDSLGDDVLEQMFSKSQIKNIRQVGQMARLVQDPIGRGGGSMLIQLTQAGGIIGALTGKFTKEAAGILLGPGALGKLMTSPAGLKWFTIGLQTPAWTPNAAAILIRVLKAAGMEDQIPPSMSSKPKDTFPFLGPTREKSQMSLSPFPKGGLFNKEKQQENVLFKTTK